MANFEDKIINKTEEGANNKAEQTEKFNIEKIDLDGLVIATKRQFLKDMADDKNISNYVSRYGLSLDNLNNLPEKEFIEFIKENENLQQLLDHLDQEGEIEEAYNQIIEYLNNKEKPTITVDKKYLEHIADGINQEKITNTYDSQKLIVGTIHRKPFSADERIVCEIENVEPSQILPRCTKSRQKLEDFKFDNIIILKNSISPENITIVSAPEGLFPPEIKLPKKINEISQYLKEAA